MLSNEDNVNISRLLTFCSRLSLSNMKYDELLNLQYTLQHAQIESKFSAHISHLRDLLEDISVILNKTQELLPEVSTDSLKPCTGNKEYMIRNARVGENRTTSVERLQTLLLEQKQLSEKELDSEMNERKAVTEQLADMTFTLKDRATQISNIVKEQNKQLDSIQDYAIGNMDELGLQKKKLNNREKAMKYSLFATLGTFIWLISLFIITYAFICIFPKPS